MKKTKIIATIGPSSFNTNTIYDMVKSGADVIRINLSHADFKFCDKAIKMIREVEKKLEKPIGIMLDLCGPSVRVDKFIENTATLQKDKEIKLYNYPVICNNTQFSVNYPDYIKDIDVDDEILLNDGKVVLKVIEKEHDYLNLQVIEGGTIRSNETIYLRNKSIPMPFINEKDHDAILYGIKKNIDFLALSYVRDEQDVLSVVDMLIEKANNHIEIISKIENMSSINNLEEIVKVSDGVMVARGDLAIEVSFEKLPTLSKMILNKTREYEKIGIVATDFLLSMEEELRPARSEITDIYNAVMDKCDAILLSGETTIGKHPVLAVDTLSKILGSAEEDFDYDSNIQETFQNSMTDITSNIAYSVFNAAKNLSARCIITNTNSGYTALKISHIKCPCPIIAFSPNLDTLRLLTINYGVIPKRSIECKSTDTIVKMCVKKARSEFDFEEGDIVIITGGFPINTKNTNFMKIEVI